MGQNFHFRSNLTEDQVDIFRLSASAACRKMHSDQILDVDDLLHEMIRKRGACCPSRQVASYAPRATASAKAPPQ